MSPATHASPSTPNTTDEPYDLSQDGPTRHGPRKRRKITRSKLGCLTCRKRKKLCDEVHPVCGSCVRMERACEWPDGDSAAATSKAGSSAQSRRQSTLEVDVDLSVSQQANADGTTTVDDFTEIFGGIDALNQLPTPSKGSFFPVSDSTSLDVDYSASNLARPSWSNMDLHALLKRGEASGDFYGGRTDAGGGTGSRDTSSIMDDLFNPNMDEATLQFCTSTYPDVTFSAFPAATSPAAQGSSATLPDATAASAPLIDPTLLGVPTPSMDDTLLRYYRDDFAPLFYHRADSEEALSLDPFIGILDAGPGGPSYHGLRDGVLALAARHRTNRGEVRYEVVSLQREEACKSRVLAKVAAGQGAEEQRSAVAGMLALLRLKLCRGDIWGYEAIHTALQTTVAINGLAGIADQTNLGLMEQLIYHDLLNTFTVRHGSIIPSSLISDLAHSHQSTLTPLLGLSFALLHLLDRVIGLVRRMKPLRGSTWDDDQHVDMVHAADDLQDELRDEKKRLDALVKSQPHLAPYRFLHESFRTACLLQIRGHVLNHTPSAIDMGLLVRQNLSLLETMMEQKLPGLASTHWVLFVTALSCIPAKNGTDERVRVGRIYDKMLDRFAFFHLKRSRRVVEEVWARNQNGERWVDWMDVVDQWGWEMFFV